MKTTFEVTLKIEVNHPNNALDENSVTALVDIGTSAIAANKQLLSTIGDEPASRVFVQVVKFKEDGKRKTLPFCGADSMP